MSSSTFFNGCKVQFLLSVIPLASQGSAYLFQPVVTSCMYWDLLSTHQASDDPYKIHCIQDENVILHCIQDENVMKCPCCQYNLESCSSWYCYCPYYDRHGKSINIRPCNSAAGKFPTKLIFSYEAVRYAGCYSSPTPSVNYSLEIGSTVTTREPNTEACTCYCTEGFIGIIAIASTFFIILEAAVILLFQVHKKMSKRTYSAFNNEENETFLHCTEQLIGSKQIPNNDRLRRSSIQIIECNTANQSFQASNNREKDVFLDCYTEPLSGSTQLLSGNISSRNIIITMEDNPTNQSFLAGNNEEKDDFIDCNTEPLGATFIQYLNGDRSSRNSIVTMEDKQTSQLFKGTIDSSTLTSRTEELGCNDENDAFLDCDMEPCIGSVQLPDDDRSSRTSNGTMEENPKNRSFQACNNEERETVPDCQIKPRFANVDELTRKSTEDNVTKYLQDFHSGHAVHRTDDNTFIGNLQKITKMQQH